MVKKRLDKKAHKDAPSDARSFHRDALRRAKTPKGRTKMPQVFIEPLKDTPKMFQDAPNFHRDAQKRTKRCPKDVMVAYVLAFAYTSLCVEAWIFFSKS